MTRSAPVPTISESFWPARFAILLIVFLQIFLNKRVRPGTSEKIQIAAGKKVAYKVAIDLKKSL